MGTIAPVFGAIVPSQVQQTLQSNYLAFNGGANDFAQQYLPEIYEQEVERYGNGHKKNRRYTYFYGYSLPKHACFRGYT